MTNQIKNFEFKSRDLSLKIAGKEFVIDLSKEGSIAGLLDVGTEAIAKAQELHAIPEVDGTDEDKARQALDTMDKAKDFVFEAVDRILGAGAGDQIFEGRKKDLFDALDLLGFIMQEVKQANADRITQRSSQYANRAQKRAVKKTKKA